MFNNVANGIVNTNDSNRFHIMGATDWNKGAHLILMGKDNAGEGAFSLSAHNGTNAVTLEGFPNGSLTWRGFEVERVNSKGVGYIRFESGLQILWGMIAYDGANNVRSYIFPLPFLDTPIMSFTAHWSDVNGNASIVHVPLSTGFTAYVPSTTMSFSWFAIGVWKAF